MSDFVTFSYSNDTICKESYAKRQLCQDDANCQVSPVYGFLVAIERFCDISDSVVRSGKNQLLAEEISSDSAIAKNNLENRVKQKFRNFNNILATAMITPLEFITAYLAMDKPLLYSQESVFSATINSQTKDLIVESTLFSSVNCTCSDSWECTRYLPNDQASVKLTSKCSILETMLISDVAIMTTNDFWSGSVSAFSMSNTAADYKFSSTQYNGQTFIDAIQSGFVVNSEVAVDYNAYYDKCSPESCVYYQETTRSFIDIVAILSGLVAGIASVLKPIVSVPWELIYKRKLKKQPSGTILNSNDNEVIQIQSNQFQENNPHGVTR